MKITVEEFGSDHNYYVSAILSTVHVIINGTTTRRLNMGVLATTSASGFCFRLLFLPRTSFTIVAVGALRSTVLLAT